MKKLYFILCSLLILSGYAQNCNNIGFENGTTSNQLSDQQVADSSSLIALLNFTDSLPAYTY
jgi:hypothetical protein